LSVEFAVMGRQ